jgi:2-oxoglutarate dehydrogenase E1 component
MKPGLKSMSASVNAWNADYLEDQFARFRADPESVSPDLRSFFRGFELGLTRSEAPRAEGSPLQARVAMLIDAYRRFGHLAARLDPFGRERRRPIQIEPQHHGLSEGDLDATVDGSSIGLGSAVPLRDLIARLEAVYCGSIGIEFMHATTPEEVGWFLERYERAAGREPVSRERKLAILELITKAETFETFLQKRYPSEKRFSVEGGESLIPLLDSLMERGSELGVEEIVLGMAHRGRLTVLNTIFGKTYEQIFTEFEDNWDAGFADSGGDVKYHRGHSGDRTFPGGRTMHVVMASNPSHLEAVDPVVLGRTRAKQRLRADLKRERVIPILVHGDAAIIGQGMLAECLNLSQLEGYTVGGCVHVVSNNLIGFTTLPHEGRSSEYCTDAAKIIGAPVLHVNGEDPEACVAAARLAIEYRQRFHRDIFVDMHCYRKFGHNEQDDQSFTQPTLAAMIRAKPSVLTRYAQQLQGEGIIGQAETREIARRLDEALDRAQKAAKTRPFDPRVDPFRGRWSRVTGEFSHDPAPTAVEPAVVAEVARALSTLPPGFTPNPRLKNVLESRAAIADAAAHARLDELILTHADAEQLAFGTLLLDGIPVRLSGQDSCRGTFSQRHAVLRDFNTGAPHVPLNSMREVGTPGIPELEPGLTRGADGRTRQARFCVYNSPLSELAVLGFDYGYSLADPDMLICWEAQFGDFANGAQVIIDQFISSAELKWERLSGLVLLLPHGHEGAGPEHSSARPERFLQLCAGENMQVVYPTTGAQVFHMLRRQVKRPFRKPLVVLQVKATLRTPTSTLRELTEGRFREILDDPRVDQPRDVRRVILCTGKIYFDLDQRRQELARRDLAIIRVEQLYPFHSRELLRVLSRYPAAAEKVWVQEEPRNYGCWTFLSELFRTDPALKAAGLPDIAFIGRDPSPSPAVGSKRIHKIEQESIVTQAVGPKPPGRQPRDAAQPEPLKAVGS